MGWGESGMTLVWFCSYTYLDRSLGVGCGARRVEFRGWTVLDCVFMRCWAVEAVQSLCGTNAYLCICFSVYVECPVVCFG